MYSYWLEWLFGIGSGGEIVLAESHAMGAPFFVDRQMAAVYFDAAYGAYPAENTVT